MSTKSAKSKEHQIKQQPVPVSAEVAAQRALVTQQRASLADAELKLKEMEAAEKVAKRGPGRARGGERRKDAAAAKVSVAPVVQHMKESKHIPSSV